MPVCHGGGLTGLVKVGRKPRLRSSQRRGVCLRFFPYLKDATSAARSGQEAVWLTPAASLAYRNNHSGRIAW